MRVNDWQDKAAFLLLVVAIGIVIVFALRHELTAIAQCKAAGGTPKYETDLVWITTDSKGGGYFAPVDLFKECLSNS